MAGRPAPISIGQQQHHIGFGLGKHLLVEHHQLDAREPVEEELPHRRRVVHAEQLGGQDEGQATARLEKQGGMHRERGPARGQPGQRDAGLEGGPARLRPGGAPEVLVADVGRVADHRGVFGPRFDGEEIRGPDLRPASCLGHAAARGGGAASVNLDAVELGVLDTQLL